MILLIDAGNSRIKWRLQCASKGRVEAEGALVHDDIDRLAGLRPQALSAARIVVNNFNFAMTGGQVAPMTPDGSVTMTTPYGSSEPPFDMCALAVTAGATYVSRTLTSNPAQMTTFIKAALDHKGFSVVEILSQCPTHFGRYALGSGSPKNLVEWIKNRTIPLSAADKLPPEETAGKYRLGEFVNIERPVFRGSTLYISDDACEACDTCGEKEEAKS